MMKNQHPGADEGPKPVDMIIYCPRCHQQHIDEPHGEWTNPPHRSHECQHCKLVWRVADVPTNGVRTLQTVGSMDSFDFSESEAVNAAVGDVLSNTKKVLDATFVQISKAEDLLRGVESTLKENGWHYTANKIHDYFAEKRSVKNGVSN